jgi:lysosomal alpha-mannosidase
MVHRRLLFDDARGVKEPLNETAYGEGLVVRGRHILIAEPPASSALYHRVSSQQLYMHPLATFSLPQQTYADYSAAYRQTWSALTDTLPLNVHLLTLDQLGPKDYLVRVEHYFELFEDDTYSYPVTIDLQSILKSIGTISNIVELTLGANLELAKLQRLDWITSEEETFQMNVPTRKFIHQNNSSQSIYLNILFRGRIVERYSCAIDTHANSNISIDNGLDAYRFKISFFFNS